MVQLTKELKVVECFVYVGCWTMLLLQIFMSCSEYLSFKTIPTIQKYKLQDVLFPDLMICHKTPFDTSKRNIKSLYTGLQYRSNVSIAEKFQGWNGPNNNETSKEYLESLANLKNVDGIQMTVNNELLGFENSVVNFDKLRINVEKGLCYRAMFTKEDIQQLARAKEQFHLEIKVDSTLNIRFYMMDQNKFNGIVFNKYSFKGDKFLDKTEKYDYLIYDIELTATELDPRDTEAECTNYGEASEFKTYKGCFEQKAKEDLAPFGCNVPWFTDNEEEICRTDSLNSNNLIMDNNKKYWSILRNYGQNSYFSPCKIPCKTVTITSKLKSHFKVNLYNETVVNVNFNPSVMVTKSILKTSPFDLINNMGSSMGLWLGISVFSIFQIFNGFAKHFLPKHGNNKRTPRFKTFIFLTLVFLGLTQFLFSVVLFWYTQVQ